MFCLLSFEQVSNIICDQYGQHQTCDMFTEEITKAYKVGEFLFCQIQPPYSITNHVLINYLMNKSVCKISMPPL